MKIQEYAQMMGWLTRPPRQEPRFMAQGGRLGFKRGKSEALLIRDKAANALKKVIDAGEFLEFRKLAKEIDVPATTLRRVYDELFAGQGVIKRTRDANKIIDKIIQTGETNPDKIKKIAKETYKVNIGDRAIKQAASLATDVSVETYLDDFKKMTSDPNYVPQYVKPAKGAGTTVNQLKARKIAKQNIQAFEEKFQRNVSKRKREKLKSALEKDPERKQKVMAKKGEVRRTRRVEKLEGKAKLTPNEKLLNFEQSLITRQLNDKIKANPDIVLKDKKLMDQLSTTVSKDGDIIKIKPNLSEIKNRGIYEIEHQRDIRKAGAMKDYPYNRNLIMGPHNRTGGFKDAAEKFITKNPKSPKVDDILKMSENLKVTLQPDVPKGIFKTKGLGYKQIGHPIEKFKSVAKATMPILVDNKIGMAGYTKNIEQMRRGLGVSQLNSFPANLQNPKFLAKEALEGSKMVGRGISKALPYALGPTGIIGLNTALGVDPKNTADRIGIEAEAVLAPSLVKGTISATDKIKNPLLRKVAERGSLALMSPAMALKAARIASPLGLVALGAEGAKFAYDDYQRRKEFLTPERIAEAQKEEFDENLPMFNEGGRIGLAKGSKGPKDPSKRLFLKGVGALTMLPILGKYFKLAEPATKAAVQYTGPVIEKIKGLEWVQFLAKRLWTEGDDVTKTAATMDGQVVRRGTLESGDEVDMIYDTRSGDVSFEVSGKDMQTTSGAYNDPYAIDYKAGEVIEETGKKTKPKIEVGEATPRQVGPEDVELEGEMFDVDSAVSDLTELEAFAKKKLTKEVHKTKGTKPKNTSPDFDGPEPDLDDYASGGRVSYFDGGIVSLKKKW